MCIRDRTPSGLVLVISIPDEIISILLAKNKTFSLEEIDLFRRFPLRLPELKLKVFPSKINFPSTSPNKLIALLRKFMFPFLDSRISCSLPCTYLLYIEFLNSMALLERRGLFVLGKAVKEIVIRDSPINRCA